MIPEPGRLRQEGQAFKTSLDYLEKLSHEMRVIGGRAGTELGPPAHSSEARARGCQYRVPNKETEAVCAS